MIALRKRRPGTNYAVLFIDLDRFKIVNDSLGHHAGDVLLVQVEERLKDRLRETDLLATTDRSSTEPVDSLARMGGDEFTILPEELHGLDDALSVADRLQASLVLPFQIDDRVVYVSASIGIAWGESSYTCADDLLRDADLAMYQAKSQGKARYEVFNTALFKAARERLELESDLRSALHRQKFVLLYQPIISLDTEQVVGFEALIRMATTGATVTVPRCVHQCRRRYGPYRPDRGVGLKRSLHNYEAMACTVPSCASPHDQRESVRSPAGPVRPRRNANSFASGKRYRPLHGAPRGD